jgi:TusA-related sulfurtransferase
MSTSDQPYDVDRTVDSLGAACPGPLMDLVGAIRSVDSGAVVRLLSDNERSTVDVPEWTAESGHELLDSIEVDDHYEFYVRKS